MLLCIAAVDGKEVSRSKDPRRKHVCHYAVDSAGWSVSTRIHMYNNIQTGVCLPEARSSGSRNAVAVFGPSECVNGV